jgi:HTH-type transcriptional regulator / antitoxin HigA
MAPANQYIPDAISHPGETLREKLEELGMGPKEFAVRTGKPEKTISLILNGESSITPDMAVLFETVLKIPARFWLRRQDLYDESLARRKRQEAIEAAIPWAKSFPYTEMAKKGWVAQARNAKEKVVQLFEFFSLATHKAWDSYYLESTLKVEFRISLAHTKTPHALSAWLRRGDILAAGLDAPEYAAKKLKAILPQLKSIMAVQPHDFFRQIQALCLSAGVKVVHTPCLPKAPIHGAARWIDGNATPLIQLSDRYKRNDVFWFSFFHELGHVLLHGKKDIFLECVDYEGKDLEKEAEADAFAIEWTLSEEQEAIIMQEQALDREKILAYAQAFNTHPALIIGRLQKKGIIPYSDGRDLIVAIDLTQE